ncbi:hypothetical protein BXP70_23035 [Hymenobacter crusticola]|uniref:Uncharacterized protein n=1 Tax=Hymenobacter crusticola TaxID=1770526 RepID=A0A243W815_9BACT|nr:hypothetical protein BXP70_23035 [Hymenobacter crusticola]
MWPFFGLAQVVITYEGTENKQFPITGKAGSAAVFYDATENTLVAKAANFLAEDIDKVSEKSRRYWPQVAPCQPRSLLLARSATSLSISLWPIRSWV